MGTSLVGRAGERSTGSHVLDEVAAARGTALLIEGEPGIGKSALLGTVLDDARSRGIRIRTASARESDRQFPFAALIDALGAGTGVLGRPASAVDRFRMVESICELVERMAVRPLVLGIEDLHWADEMTLVTLDRLIRRAPHMALAVVCTTRRHTSSVEWASLVATAEDHHVVRLHPLADGEVRRLAHQIVGGAPGPELTRQLTGAAGNPMYVVELLAALRAEGALRTTTDGTIDVGGPHLPDAFRDVVAREVAAVGTTTAECLRIASVLGTVFHLPDLATVADRPLPDVVADLQPALASGLLVADSDRFAFRHDLVREALYHGIPMPERVSLHRHVAQSLREAGHALTPLADHVLKGACTGDAETIRWLRETAADVGVHAPATAVELLERAHALTTADHPDRLDVSADLAGALAWAGRPEEASRLARLVLASPTPNEIEQRTVVALTHALNHLGASDAATAESLEVLAHRPGTAAADRARLLGEAAWSWAMFGDRERIVEVANDALVLAENVGDPVAEMLALAAILAAEKVSGAFVALDERVARLEALFHDPTVLESPHGLEVLMWKAVELAKMAERRDDATAMLRAGLEAAEQRSVVWLVAPYHHMLGHVEFVAGAWDDAETHLEQAAELALRTGTRWFLWECYSDLATIALQRHGPSDSERWVHRAEAQQTRSWTEASVVLLVRAELLEDRGDLRAAFEHYERAASLGGRSIVFAGPGLARTAHALGERAHDLGVAARIRQVAGNPLDHLTALRCEGWAHSDSDAVVEAAAGYAQNGWRSDEAHTYEEAATLLLGNGAPEEAIAVLRRAARNWADCGAVRAERRVQSRLRALGVQPPAQRRSTSETGWDSLTDAELRVAELVSEGLIYREIGERLFISRRTVETHVSHMFSKLGISSRVDLAARYRCESQATNPNGRSPSLHH